MKRWKFTAAMLTAALAFSTTGAIAEEAEPGKMPPPPQQQQREEGRPQREGRGPRMERREMNPEFLMAMMVRKELKACQENPCDETYAALEKALHEALAKFAVRHKEELTKRIAAMQKELETFDAKQAEAEKAFLEKVKKGEFKMPEPPRGDRGPRPGRMNMPEGEMPPPPPADK